MRLIKIIWGTFTLGVQEAEAWLYKFKQCYVAFSVVTVSVTDTET